jgi:nucleotide-binding universal stress UspA family protein
MTMKISEILLPTDFSAAAETAALVATAMARETGARLHVVHVVPPATDPTLGSEELARLGRRLGTGLTVEPALLSGRAAREITAYARDKGIDLIVISTHGRTGVSRTLLGSVAEAVVRLSPCLVLTVPMALPAARTPAASLVHAGAHAGAAPVPQRCIVCAGQTDDLVCDMCRARIRGKALEHKIETERTGQRGSSA